MVVIKILQTDRGVVFFGQHEADRDAQKVFEKVLTFYTDTRNSDIDFTDILKYITSARLGTGNCNGTTVSLIFHWQEKVRQYNKIVDEAKVIGPELMHTLLKNAAFGILELRQVQDTADPLKVVTGREPTYEDYCSLLVSAAITYDDNHKPKTFNPRRDNDSRKVY